MSSEQLINVLLIHILEKLTLLLSKLLSLESILLLLKLVKELHLLLFHFVLPIIHAVLALHKFFMIGLFFSLQVIDLLLLVAICLAFEVFKFFSAIFHYFLQVLLDRFVIFSSILK